MSVSKAIQDRLGTYPSFSVQRKLKSTGTQNVYCVRSRDQDHLGGGPGVIVGNVCERVKQNYVAFLGIYKPPVNTLVNPDLSMDSLCGLRNDVSISISTALDSAYFT